MAEELDALGHPVEVVDCRGCDTPIDEEFTRAAVQARVIATLQDRARQYREVVENMPNEFGRVDRPYMARILAAFDAIESENAELRAEDSPADEPKRTQYGDRFEDYKDGAYTKAVEDEMADWEWNKNPDARCAQCGVLFKHHEGHTGSDDIHTTCARFLPNTVPAEELERPPSIRQALDNALSPLIRGIDAVRYNAMLTAMANVVKDSMPKPPPSPKDSMAEDLEAVDPAVLTQAFKKVEELEAWRHKSIVEYDKLWDEAEAIRIQRDALQDRARKYREVVERLKYKCICDGRFTDEALCHDILKMYDTIDAEPK